MRKFNSFWLVFLGLILVLSLVFYFLATSFLVVLPDDLQMSIGRSVGLDVLKERDSRNQDLGVGTENLEQFGVINRSLRKPVTVFVPEQQQTIDGHVLSRGFDLDGFERVMLRGQFGAWQDVSLVADVLGRQAFTVQSAGKEWTIYTGKTVKMKCQNRMFYDKNGKGHDLTKVMVEYDQHVDEAKLVPTEKVVSMFQPGDEMAVVARYGSEVMEALLMVGYDCEI